MRSRTVRVASSCIALSCLLATPRFALRVSQAGHSGTFGFVETKMDEPWRKRLARDGVEIVRRREVGTQAWSVVAVIDSSKAMASALRPFVSCALAHWQAQSRAGAAKGVPWRLAALTSRNLSRLIVMRLSVASRAQLRRTLPAKEVPSSEDYATRSLTSKQVAAPCRAKLPVRS